MNEEGIRQSVLKIHSFDEFPYKRMREVLDAIEKLGFSIKFVDNGNIVCFDVKEKEGEQ